MQAFIVVLVTCCLLVAGTYAHASARVRSADRAYDALRTAVRMEEDLKSSPFYPAFRESLRSSFEVALSDEAVQQTADPSLIDTTLIEIQIQRLESGTFDAVQKEANAARDKAIVVEKCLGAYLRNTGREDRLEAVTPLTTRDDGQRAEWARAYAKREREYQAMRDARATVERNIELG